MGIRLRRIVLPALCVFLVAVGGVACGDTTYTLSSVETLGPTTDSTDAAVVGGAPVIVKPGSPPMCRDLAASVAVRGIAASVAELAVEETAASGADGLRAAARDLRVVARSVEGEAARAMQAVAGSLVTLADRGIEDQSAVDVLVRDLGHLGTEVQDDCEFPQGTEATEDADPEVSGLYAPGRATLMAGQNAIVGPASGLCSMNTRRGAVPANFALDACVDGSAIVLHNQLSVPVTISYTGNSGSIVSLASDGSVAAMITRVRYPDPSVMLPGDTVRIPIGSAAASVSIKDTDAGGFYALATTLAAFLPLGVGVRVYEAVATGIAEMIAAHLEYQNCMATSNWIGQIGCEAKRTAAITYSFGKMVVVGVAKGALGLLLDVGQWFSFIDKQVPSIQTIANSERTLTQSAVSTGGGGGSGGGGSGGSGGSGSGGGSSGGGTGGGSGGSGSPDWKGGGGSVDIACPSVNTFLTMVTYGFWPGLPPVGGLPQLTGNFVGSPLCVQPSPPYPPDVYLYYPYTMWAAATLDVQSDRDVTMDTYGQPWTAGTTVRVRIVMAGNDSGWLIGWGSGLTVWRAGQPLPAEWVCFAPPDRLQAYLGC